jgi:hypothetical protein
MVLSHRLPSFIFSGLTAERICCGGFPDEEDGAGAFAGPVVTAEGCPTGGFAVVTAAGGFAVVVLAATGGLAAVVVAG